MANRFLDEEKKRPLSIAEARQNGAVVTPPGQRAFLGGGPSQEAINLRQGQFLRPRDVSPGPGQTNEALMSQFLGAKGQTFREQQGAQQAPHGDQDRLLQPLAAEDVLRRPREEPQRREADPLDPVPRQQVDQQRQR